MVFDNPVVGGPRPGLPARPAGARAAAPRRRAIGFVWRRRLARSAPGIGFGWHRRLGSFGARAPSGGPVGRAIRPHGAARRWTIGFVWRGALVRSAPRPGPRAIHPAPEPTPG